MMGQSGMLLFYMIAGFVNIAAFWKLLPRAGMTPYWGLLGLFLPASIILFWVVAFKRWPNDGKVS